MLSSPWLWALFAPLIAGTCGVALCGASRPWRLLVLALNLVHLPLLHAALASFGHSFPVLPMAAAIAFAGILPECVRTRKMRAEADAAVHEPVADAEVAVSGNESATAVASAVMADNDGEPSLAVSADREDLECGDLEAGTLGADPVEAPIAVPGEEQIKELIAGRLEERASPEPADPATPQTPPPPNAFEEPVREECTVMHCEISNHAMLVNALPPVEFAEMINRVLSIFESMVRARGGVCDRLGSDGMRAFFRPDAEGEGHAQNALQCALALRTRLESISEQCELHCGHELDLRLGINSGTMVVAAFGTRDRSALSVAGEAAEWGVRLAGANLLYGSRILLGARTGDLALGTAETRPIDLLQRQLPPEPPEEVFELLALRGTLAPEALDRLERYREGVAHFRARRWRDAAAALRAARPPQQDDDAIDLLLHRISEQEALAAYAVDGH